MARVFMSPTDFVKVRTPSTKKGYTIALKLFCQSTFGNDDCTNLVKYVKSGDKSKILSDLLSFRAFLEEEKEKPATKKTPAKRYYLAPNTKKLYIAAVRTYLSVNEIVYTRSQASQLEIKDKSKTDDYPFTIETAKATYEQLSFSGKAAFLFLISSGCRIGETLQIHLKDVDWNHKPVKVKLRAVITKTKTERIVFISDECADYLKTVWLPRRTEFMESAKNRNRGLVNQKIGEDGVARNAKKRPAIEADQRLFPFSLSNFHTVFVSAIERAGLSERNDLNLRKLHPHSTRKFFRNAMGRWGSPDSAEYLMGHEQGLTSVYRTPSNEQLVTDYKNAMPYMTIGMTEEGRVAIQTRDITSGAVVQLQANALQQEAEIVKWKARVEKLEREAAIRDSHDVQEAVKSLP